MCRMAAQHRMLRPKWDGRVSTLEGVGDPQRELELKQVETATSWGGQPGVGCQSLSGLKKASIQRGGPVKGVRAKQSEEGVAWPLELATEPGEENFWVEGQPEMGGKCPCRRAAWSGESAPEQGQEGWAGMGCPNPSRMLRASR